MPAVVQKSKRYEQLCGNGDRKHSHTATQESVKCISVLVRVVERGDQGRGGAMREIRVTNHQAIEQFGWGCSCFSL